MKNPSTLKRSLAQEAKWFFTFWKLRLQIWWFGRNLKLAVREVMKMSIEQAAPIITKWKWDASRCDDVQIRDALLDSVYKLEEYLKRKHEHSGT